MKTFAVLITCLSFTFFAVGCYSLQRVNVAEHRMLKDEEIVKIVKTDGRALVYKNHAVDSAAITDSGMTLYLKNGGVSMLPSDSLRSLYTDQFNVRRTIIFSVVTALPVAFVALVVIFVASGMRVG